MSSRTELLVLGVGNTLCMDDGLGPSVVNLLREHVEFDERVVVIDGGTLGLSLLPLLQDSDRLILVDAIAATGPPGTLVRLVGDDVLPAARLRLSPHQVGIGDLLDAARLLDDLPHEIVLLGLVPESIDLGTEPTPRVAANIPILIDAVIEEVERLGFGVMERTCVLQ